MPFLKLSDHMISVVFYSCARPSYSRPVYVIEQLLPIYSNVQLECIGHHRYIYSLFSVCLRNAPNVISAPVTYLIGPRPTSVYPIAW